MVLLYDFFWFFLYIYKMLIKMLSRKQRNATEKAGENYINLSEKAKSRQHQYARD